MSIMAPGSNLQDRGPAVLSGEHWNRIREHLPEESDPSDSSGRAGRFWRARWLVPCSRLSISVRSGACSSSVVRTTGRFPVRFGTPWWMKTIELDASGKAADAMRGDDE